MPVHKRIIGGIGGAISGFVTGGPSGALRGGVKGFVGKPKTQVPMIAPTFRGRELTTLGGFAGGGGRQGPDVPRGLPGAVPEPGFRGGLQRALPFGQTGYTAAPPGYHVNKAYLRFLRAQEMGRDVQDPFNEQRAVNVIVRNRKLNPLNPRALMRANARQVGAVRMMRRTLRGTGYVIQRSRFGTKKGRRR